MAAAGSNRCTRSRRPRGWPRLSPGRNLLRADELPHTGSGKILRRVLDLLGERHDFQVTEFLKKPYIGNVAPKEYFDRIFASQANAVLVGIGD